MSVPGRGDKLGECRAAKGACVTDAELRRWESRSRCCQRENRDPELAGPWGP